MNIQILLDGVSVVKAEVDISQLSNLLSGTPTAVPAVAHSTPATRDQMTDLLSRVDQKSVHFLRVIAASPVRPAPT